MWTVRRRWIANRSVRWRGKDLTRDDDGGWRNWLDMFGQFDFLPDDNPLAVIGLVIGAVLGALFLLGFAWFVLVPLLLAIVDLALLILLTLLGLIARLVLRHPWEIEALGPDDRHLTWQVSGWQRSRRTLTAITGHLTQGQIPPTDSPAFPPPDHPDTRTAPATAEERRLVPAARECRSCSENVSLSEGGCLPVGPSRPNRGDGVCRGRTPAPT